MNEGRRQTNLFIALGISAIDVLCCALVCSIVLFLMFANSAKPKAQRSGLGTNRDIVVVFQVEANREQTNATMPLLRVRAAERTMEASEGTTFWSDKRSDSGVDGSGKYLQADGGVYWSSDITNDTSTTPARTSILQIHRPVPGSMWALELAYKDTNDELLATAPGTVSVKVEIQGITATECRVALKLGGAPLILPSDASEIQGCHAADSLSTVPQN